MWSLENRTPYEVESSWGRDKNGVHEWIVAVKATFNVNATGSLVPAGEQLKLRLVPEYNGEDGASSLRYDSDLVGPKPCTDVILNGTAHAPKGRASTEFPVSIRIDGIHKQIKVIGHRTWERRLLGIGPSPAEPVSKVPIVYERAYGGFDQSDPDPVGQRLDTRNPVGCGLVTEVGQALPNFEYPDGRIEKAGPAGFGAIASYWSPRRELSGTYDDAWRKSRYPLLPADWDPRSLLCSPPDQRPETHLEGGESVELENVTPEGLLRFTLPRMRFAFRTLFKTVSGTRAKEHEGRLGTVILEPDYPRVMLVWISVLPCRTDGDYLEQTIVEGGDIT